MKVCASIAESTIESSISSAADAVELGADLVEIRLDALQRPPSSLDGFKAITVPKIATLRTASQGGRYEGKDEDRHEILNMAVASGFDFVDLESSSRLFSKLGKVKIVCSHHDLAGTPETSKIIDILVGCLAKGHMAKAAFKVNSIKDLVSINDAARFVSSTEKDFIIIGMGELGEITRIRADQLNSAWTYASLEKGRETAPGQLDIRTIKSLGSDPMIFGITGYPLTHTASPSIHNSALREMGINGKYLKFKASKDELEDLIYIMIEMNIRGMNVTIPHKEHIIEWMDELSPDAKTTGAVNTIVNKGGRLIGLNTDVAGLRKTFESHRIDASEKRSLIIGAGGAARACSLVLKESGSDIYITNRTRSHAEKLGDKLGASVIDLEKAEETNFDIVINCTPLGMSGFPSGMPISSRIFRPGQVVMDLIYDPSETQFLKEAKKNGATTISGMEMLIYQAMDSFEAWTGRAPSYDVMAKPARDAVG